VKAYRWVNQVVSDIHCGHPTNEPQEIWYRPVPLSAPPPVASQSRIREPPQEQALSSSIASEDAEDLQIPCDSACNLPCTIRWPVR